MAAIAALTVVGCGPPAPEVVLWYPIDCTLGDDCWFSSRPDRDPTSPGSRDHSGGTHTYDGHDGTDLTVPDAGHARYTWVVAPAAGTVIGHRDTHPDGELAAYGLPGVDGHECGNGVRLDLGRGWVVQLCHLHRGSVAVKTGQTVAAGDRLGRVGWSGEADGPHVHVGVSRDGRDVDPFDGQYLDDGTPASFAPLWATPVPAPSSVDALVWVGFDLGPRRGVDGSWPYDSGRAVIPAGADGLALGVFLWRPEAGDVVSTAITTPSGVTTTGTGDQPRTRPREMIWIDKTWPPTAPPKGLWTARVEWRRGDRSRVMYTSTVVR